MSGHNKWSKIKRKKGAEDAKKSREFSRFAQLITVEVKKAGGDASSPAVRQVIERAKQVNTPNDNIERAIKRGQSKDAAALEEVVYEAYGPAGIALIIHGFTDNKNRTSAEIKHILSEHGASLAGPGAASWAFTKEGDTWTASSLVPIADAEKEKVRSLVDALEESENINGVYTNAEL